MKVILVGGWKKVDFLAKGLLEKKHDVTIIHDDESYCKTLSRHHDSCVICGDGSKSYVLRDANIDGSDIIIALTPKDADNLVICQMAKKVFGVKKAFAIVANPKNVDVFKNLGINSVISSTYIVAGIIEQMTTLDEINQAIPIEKGAIVVLEMTVKKEYPVCGKTVQEINMPEKSIIGCIIRNVGSIIPKGKTRILADDKLIILSPPNIQKDVIRIVVGGIK